MSHPQSRSRVAGTGRYLPERTLDNHQLYALDSIRENFQVERARASLRDSEGAASLPPEEVFDRWARQVTGIVRRRIADPDGDLTTEEMCARASRRALESAGMEVSDLDFIVAATVTASDDVPNAACTIGKRLGIPHCPGYTLNAACAAFVHGLAAADSHIRSGLAENVLVVTGDTLSRITDYTDPKTAVLFGDAAGAAVLTGSDGGRPGLLGSPCLSADYAREHLYMVGQAWLPDHEEEPVPARLRMGGGPRVLRRAIQAMAVVAEGAMDTTDRSWDEVDFVIPHQANLRITEGLERQLALENGRVIHTIQEYGNASASTVSLTFDEVIRGEHGPVPDPALFVLTAVGGGYTSGAVVVEHSPR